MTNDDLIRREDALAAITIGATVTKLQAAIAALPAVHPQPVGVTIRPDLADVRAMLDRAEADWAHLNTISATIRVNAMRHGATNAEIEAFVSGEADFVNWLAGKITPAVPTLSSALALPEIAALVKLTEEFVTATWHLLDNSETSGPIDDPAITVWQPDFDEVSALLDRCEGLPSGSTEHMTAGELLSANMTAAITALRAQLAEANARADRAEAALAAQIEVDARIVDALYRMALKDSDDDLASPWKSHKASAYGTALQAIRNQTHDRTALNQILAAIEPAPVTLADALQVPEVRALAYAAKAVMHDMRHGNGLEGLRVNRSRLAAALRAIGEGKA